MSGGRPFSLERQKALIRYIREREPGVSRLKLRSLLYLIDNAAYLRLGGTITGATYRKGKQTVIVEGLNRSLKEIAEEDRIPTADEILQGVDDVFAGRMHTPAANKLLQRHPRA